MNANASRNMWARRVKIKKNSEAVVKFVRKVKDCRKGTASNNGAKEKKMRVAQIEAKKNRSTNVPEREAIRYFTSNSISV